MELFNYVTVQRQIPNIKRKVPLSIYVEHVRFMFKNQYERLLQANKVEVTGVL